MKRLVVLVSGGGSNLQAVMDACKVGTIPAEIVAVFSNTEKAYGLERARKENIPTGILTKFNYDAILDYNPDGVILAGYLKIIPEDFVDTMEGKIINIHPSLIPSFCGAGYYGSKVHKAVLDKGVKLSGATTHFVSAIPDAGPIIMQESVPVYSDDTVDSLSKRVLEIEHKIIVETVKAYCEDRITLVGNVTSIEGVGNK